MFLKGAAQAAARRRHNGVREHDALATHAHQPAPLRRLHRLFGEGARDVHAGARRPAPVHAAHREHEGGVQGQKEAHVPRQGALRLASTDLGPCFCFVFFGLFCFVF